MICIFAALMCWYQVHLILLVCYANSQTSSTKVDLLSFVLIFSSWKFSYFQLQKFNLIFIKRGYYSLNFSQIYLRIPEKSRELFSFLMGNEKLAPHSVTFSLHFKTDIRPLTRIRPAQCAIGSKLIGEPEALKNPPGSGNLKCKQIYLLKENWLIQPCVKLKSATNQSTKHLSCPKWSLPEMLTPV